MSCVNTYIYIYMSYVNMYIYHNIPQYTARESLASWLHLLLRDSIDDLGELRRRAVPGLAGWCLSNNPKLSLLGNTCYMLH